ncbi:uncharacterized protein LOC111287243 [Durio zibethinus]|uniref:Uncharacterized protein LOC111287243 n=1 Tax=Durio zibethinus TaxID=66656 RepID=A0A6P5XYX7_DURZI|nr:uncharacterized protein LOC111287243 [Durio zibethinus]
MASVQCYKPNEKTSCHQNPSLGEKVSEMASSIFKGHGSNHGHGQTTERYSQTEVYYTDHGVEKTQTEYYSSQTEEHSPRHTMSHTSQTNGHQSLHHASGAMACQGKAKKRGEGKKRGLLQKIKDGLSGDSSSSDSESDDEKCGTRKN